MTPINASAVRVSQTLVRVLGVGVIVIGCGSFFGWVFDQDLLKSPLQDGITMKANASLGLMSIGATLLLLRRPREKQDFRYWAGKTLAAIGSLIGGLTLFQHLTGVDLGIDQLLFQEAPGALATSSPGRMGRPASLCLLLSGLSLLLLDSTKRRGRRAGQILAATVCTITLIPLIGYAFGVAQLYGLPGYTGIAFHTAIAVLMAGLGILFSRPTEGIMAIVCADDAGGMMARRLVPAAFLLPIITWWLRILAERAGWIEPSLARPLAVLFLSGCSVIAVLWNARRMSTLEVERQRIERERQLGYERTIEILESISDAFYAIDAAGRFTYINRQAEELWGRSRASLLGKSLAAEFSETANDAQSIAHREVMATHQPRRYESYSARIGRWFDVSLYPELGGGVSGFFRDVTERKQVEEELRRARDSAEKANRTKSEFLATLSHEMRTPLNPVLLTLDYLEGHPAFPRELTGELASIRSHLDLEIQLISDLLDITRIESGKLQLIHRDVDLHAVVRAAVVMCTRSDGPDIEMDLQADKFFVRGDSVRLHQIIWNLLNNAQKFTEAAGRVVLRTLSPRLGMVRLEVVDNGRGINAEMMPRLFHAFEQGETLTARQRSGLGLGLTITRKIVEAHQGTIVAESDGPGRGSRFVVELPALSANIKDQQADSPLVPSGPGPLRILLVEDHLPTLNAMTRLLKIIGHTVEATTTCAAAEEASAKGNFDLLISDLGLPDSSGLELMKRLRPQFSGRAIALTGYGSEKDIRAAREAGFSEHLTKPVQLNLLRTTIAQVVAQEIRPV